MKFKKKIPLKSVITIAVGILAIFLCAACVVSITGKDTESVSKLSFKIGGISSETGEYVERKDTLYTYDLIECQGLSVTPDFNNTVEYQIFWYNEDEVYFDSTDIIKAKFVSGVPELARYCRIMVYPSKLDEDGKTIKDFEVKFYEVQKYVSDLNMKVYKDQTWAPIDYYEAAFDKLAPDDHTPSLNDSYLAYEDWIFNGSNFAEGMQYYSGSGHALIKMESTKDQSYKITFNDTGVSHTISVVYFSSDGTKVETRDYSGAPGDSVIVEISSENIAYTLIGVNDVSKPVVINKYLPR